MSDTYNDIPEETLHDVMWEIAEGRERRDLVDPRGLIDAKELKRRLTKQYNRRMLADAFSPSYRVGRRAALKAAFETIDEMQGR